MKIKIIKNAPNNSNISDTSDISEYIGRIFNAKPLIGTSNVSIDFGFDRGTMTVYPNEYEFVDMTKELEDFINKYYSYDTDSQDIRDFILGNRTALVKILQ